MLIADDESIFFQISSKFVEIQILSPYLDSAWIIDQMSTNKPSIGYVGTDINLFIFTKFVNLNFCSQFVKY